MDHLVGQYPFKVLVSTLNFAFEELSQVSATDLATHEPRLITTSMVIIDNIHAGSARRTDSSRTHIHRIFKIPLIIQELISPVSS